MPDRFLGHLARYWPPDDELLVEQFEAPEFKALVEDRARERLEGLVTPDVRRRLAPI